MKNILIAILITFSFGSNALSFEDSNVRRLTQRDVLKLFMVDLNIPVDKFKSLKSLVQTENIGDEFLSIFCMENTIKEGDIYKLIHARKESISKSLNDCLESLTFNQMENNLFSNAFFQLVDKINRIHRVLKD